MCNGERVAVTVLSKFFLSGVLWSRLQGSWWVGEPQQCNGEQLSSCSTSKFFLSGAPVQVARVVLGERLAVVACRSRTEARNECQEKFEQKFQNMLILTLVSLLVMASANDEKVVCGNSTDRVALVTLTNPYNNAAKIDFCSKGSTNIKCSSCEYKSGEHKGDKPEVWTPPQYTVTVGIGADVGFLLFAEEWVHRPRTEGLYPNASGYWPSNYTLPKFPTPVPTCSHQNIPCGQKWDSACCNGLTCKQDDNSFYICQNLTNASSTVQ